MAWTIEYTNTARKQIRKLDRRAARRILDYMDERVVQWTAHARGDLLRIVEYIASDNPVTAGRIMDRLIERAGSLSRMAERGRIDG